MKKIPLRNISKESVIIAVGSFLIAAVLIYLAFFKEIELRVSGANIDAATSQILLILIALGPLIIGVNSIIKYLSIKKLDSFGIELHTTKIVYPESNFLKGFSKKEINRELIHEVKIVRVDRNNEHIYLSDQHGLLKGYIDAGMLSQKETNTQQLYQELENWLLN
jgi:hypothetical protein